VLESPKNYANLAEVMLYANSEAHEKGLTVPHTADDIAEAWKTWVTEGELIWTDEYRRFMYWVPEGFLTDFASIPRVFRWLFDPVGTPWHVAGVLHDYLYSSTTESRADADKAYYWLARAMGTAPLPALLMYVALRIGGWMAYTSNQNTLAREGYGWRFLGGLPSLEEESY